MRLTTILLTLALLEVNHADTVANGSHAGNSPRKSVFNVVDYGAVGDDEKDNPWCPLHNHSCVQ